MIIFPNAKINLGLSVKEKRADGFHNIETVFYPVDLYDVVEFKESHKLSFKLWNSDVDLSKNNSLLKMFRLIKQDYNIPDLEIHLLKNIPDKAGLGGGSSDASFFLKSLNQYFNLKISDKKLIDYSLKVGSDCAFFIKNNVSFATGRGEILKQINLNLSDYYIVIIKPFNISIDTKTGYENIIRTENNNISNIEEISIDLWKTKIFNDFENYAFNKFPELKKIKEYLYNKGAVFALMTGSGSAVYGIFKTLPEVVEYENCFIWKGKLTRIIHAKA